ncbi:MAG: ABC transporter ATP-binding protein [Deltaproteobacteria bacterium RIFCSPLOWO2_12_FULL_60_19]|jgi:putative ABC transport system ATP-binding protein|nr:MAG: ABC transporter ATP-binding protein [Deltaproteobacteria bacterium RIFCSPLOWO2_12_FULL_60_19]
MIQLINVHKIYRQGATEIIALAGVSLEVGKGEFAVIMGPSGSGKSTLLHLIGGLDQPNRGDVLVDGRLISQLSDDQLTLFRRATVGFVFQFFNLLPTLSAVENVMLPLILDAQARSQAYSRAERILERVGLAERKNHLPEELSGGEIQRLAIARALAFNPSILLADEPTGNLDSKTGAQVLELIREVNRQQGCTVVMVTHDKEAAGFGDRVIQLKDGMTKKRRRS